MTNALLGWMPGGLAIVSLFACAFFTALTGASGATIIALGAILYPAMKQAGYPERFNLGLITSSGSLGLLFLPSIALILYGVIAQQMNLDQPVTIDDLFIAGLLPGLLMLALLVAWSMYKSVGEKIPKEDLLLFTALSGIKDWRRKLDNSWEQAFELDGHKWKSVEHFYNASKFLKNHPDYYLQFRTLSYGGPWVHRRANGLWRCQCRGHGDW